MASRAKKEQADAGASEVFVPRVMALGRDHDPRWPLAIKEPVLYFASVDRYQLVGGEMLPHPAMSRIRAGATNVDRHGNPSGLMGVQMTWGRVLVPPDWEVEAFGTKARGYNRRLEVRVTDARGGREYHHCPIWQRPRKVGGRIEWDRDGKGWLIFLRRIHDELLGGGDVDDAVQRGILHDILRQVEALQRRSSDPRVLERQIAALKKRHPSLRGEIAAALKE